MQYSIVLNLPVLHNIYMENSFDIFISVLGWIGALATFSAYYLVSSKKLAPDSLKYHALNMGGAALLAVMCFFAGAWPSVVSNIIFILIGVNVIFTVKRKYLVNKISYKKIKNDKDIIVENTNKLTDVVNSQTYINNYDLKAHSLKL